MPPCSCHSLLPRILFSLKDVIETSPGLNSQVESTQTSRPGNDSICLHVLEVSVEHLNLLRKFAKCANSSSPTTGDLFKNVRIFIHLAAPTPGCGTQDLQSSSQHVEFPFSLFWLVGSSSLTRDQTWASCIGNVES